MANARTTVTIDGKYAFTLEEDGLLPSSGVYNSEGESNDLSLFNWSFPVHWDDGRNSGDFIIGGDGDGGGDAWAWACAWLKALAMY